MRHREARQPRGRRRGVISVVVVTLLAALCCGGWLLQRPESASPLVMPDWPQLELLTFSKPANPCDSPASDPFTPTSISIAGITADAPVMPRPRGADGRPLAPPLTTAGKQLFAWDQPPSIMPGSAQGNVLLNAHTWPDGSALGNRMLADLHEGDLIEVHGKDALLCYKVTQELEVRTEDGYVPYYIKDGPPQIAIVVCSGTRTAPGKWSHRTMWFASPVQSA